MPGGLGVGGSRSRKRLDPRQRSQHSPAGSLAGRGAWKFHVQISKRVILYKAVTIFLNFKRS